MSSETEKAVIEFIKMARCEALTMVPRLPEIYAKNQRAIAELAKDLLDRLEGA